jgi:hypothetical protein
MSMMIEGHRNEDEESGIAEFTQSLLFYMAAEVNRNLEWNARKYPAI